MELLSFSTGENALSEDLVSINFISHTEHVDTI